MKRVDEIKAAAIREYGKRPIGDKLAALVTGFCKGAKWSDDNPNFNSKKITSLDRLSKALEESNKKEPIIIHDTCEWIDVHESLPENENTVLVLVERRTSRDARPVFIPALSKYHPHRKYWDTQYVVFWTPIPDLPEVLKKMYI